MLLYTLGDDKGTVIIQCGTDEFPLYSLGCYVLRGPSATFFVTFLSPVLAVDVPLSPLALLSVPATLLSMLAAAPANVLPANVLPAFVATLPPGLLYSLCS